MQKKHASLADAVHKNRTNVIIVGAGMSIVLLGVKMMTSFAVPILGTIGSICMSILWFASSFANFLVPSIISLFETEMSVLFWLSIEYGLYVISFCYIFPPLNYFLSFVHGIIAAVFWAAQGLYLSSNSNSQNRGQNSGLFWTIYMLGAVIGNIGIFFILRTLNLNQSSNISGWNDKSSWMFIVMGLISLSGCIVMLKLRPSFSKSSQLQMMTQRERIPAKRLLKRMLKQIIDKDMVFLILPLFFLGFQSVFTGAMITRQARNTSNVGLYMSVYSLIETVISVYIGKAIDRFGSMTVMTAASLFECIALFLVPACNQYQNYLFFNLFSFFALSDSAYQTLLPAIIGQRFRDQESAQSVFRLFQNLGGSICYIIAPLFSDLPGSKFVSEGNLMKEVYLCGGLCLTSLTSHVFFENRTKGIQLKSIRRVFSPRSEKEMEDMEGGEKGDNEQNNNDSERKSMSIMHGSDETVVHIPFEEIKHESPNSVIASSSTIDNNSRSNASSTTTATTAATTATAASAVLKSEESKVHSKYSVRSSNVETEDEASRPKSQSKSLVDLSDVSPVIESNLDDED